MPMVCGISLAKIRGDSSFWGTAVHWRVLNRNDDQSGVLISFSAVIRGFLLLLDFKRSCERGILEPSAMKRQILPEISTVWRASVVAINGARTVIAGFVRHGAVSRLQLNQKTGCVQKRYHVAAPRSASDAETAYAASCCGCFQLAEQLPEAI